MKEAIVVLLPKSPRPRRGRVGPEEWQDWYRGCVRAVALASEQDAPILVPSAFKIGDGISEAGFYRIVLKKTGAADVEAVDEGLETIGQLEAVFKAATGKKLIVVSSILHFPRVWWLCRGKGAQHSVIWGIPRPSEAITDLVLAFIFPFIDVFGLKDEFQKRSVRRRETGKI